MNKNDKISREHFDEVEIKRENDVQKKFQDDLTPTPSGKHFLEMFSSILSNKYMVKHLPYMNAISLNKDIILYRAMAIVLSFVIGKNNQDTKLIRSIVTFMSGDAMTSLRDNSFASNEHENTSRKVCLRFLKKLSK